MNNLLDQAVEALRKLPTAQQEAFARALMAALPDETGVHGLTPEERKSIDRSKAQARQGEFVPDAEVEAYWRSLGL
ncbi:MAG TPA: hypothetical protein VHB73_07325 [Alphaproteobacteria bacterium]|nr:hypothetical protein [Alphaproteobacteria bacterium]